MPEEKEHQMQYATDQIRKDKDAQINAINNQLANALIELRNRPNRANKSIQQWTKCHRK